MRMDAPVLPERSAQQFLGAVGDHLVEVHVERGAGAALECIDLDPLVEPARDDLAAGGEDGVGLLLGQEAELGIGAGAGQLRPAPGRGSARAGRVARADRSWPARGRYGCRSRHRPGPGSSPSGSRLDPRAARWRTAVRIPARAPDRRDAPSLPGPAHLSRRRHACPARMRSRITVETRRSCVAHLGQIARDGLPRRPAPSPAGRSRADIP